MTSGDSDRVLLVGPSAPGDPALLAVALRIVVGDLADDPRRGAVDLGDMGFGAIIGLADGVGVEGVGGEDVDARIGELAGDLLDQLGPGEVEQIVVAALVLEQVETAAIILARQPPRLDRRAVGAVLDQDALRRFGAKGVGGAHALALTPSKWQIA